VGLGPADVQAEGPVAGHDQEPESGRAQPLDLARPAGGPGQAHGLGVVVGQDLGVVLDPVDGGPLDPGGGGQVSTVPP